MSPPTVWNEDRKRRLSVMVETGASTTQIAYALSAEFGLSLSRNSVIGAMHRYGFISKCALRGDATWSDEAKRRNREAAALRERLRRQSVRLGQGKPAAPSIPLPVDYSTLWESAASLPLLDRNMEQCPWPIGPVMEKSTLCCGANKLRAAHYCERHEQAKRARS